MYLVTRLAVKVTHQAVWCTVETNSFMHSGQKVETFFPFFSLFTFPELSCRVTNDFIVMGVIMLLIRSFEPQILSSAVLFHYHWGKALGYLL